MEPSDHGHILLSSQRVREDALRMRATACSMREMARGAVDASRLALARACQQQERMAAQLERAEARRAQAEVRSVAWSRAVREDVWDDVCRAEAAVDDADQVGLPAVQLSLRRRRTSVEGRSLRGQAVLLSAPAGPAPVR